MFGLLLSLVCLPKQLLYCKCPVLNLLWMALNTDLWIRGFTLEYCTVATLYFLADVGRQCLTFLYLLLVANVNNIIKRHKVLCSGHKTTVLFYLSIFDLLWQAFSLWSSISVEHNQVIQSRWKRGNSPLRYVSLASDVNKLPSLLVHYPVLSDRFSVLAQSYSVDIMFECNI